MHIANPIYDVVFKYLMEDSKIAKLLISSIIKQDIEIIDFRPQEFTADFDKNNKIITKKKSKNTKKKNEPTFFTVYRLDFSAKIKTPEGEKIVLIEIQKAKLSTDIMRFRNYLGTQYSNKENIYITNENGRRVKKACEIISIYFLGNELENIHGVPVIKSQKTYIDVSSGKEIKQKEYFIDSLNHESYTIPIPELKAKRRNELEKLLSVFDQSNRTSDIHILNVKEEDFPEECRDLIRRLQKAANEPEIRKKMDLEDEIIEELSEKEREIAMKDVLLKEKDKQLEIEKIKREDNEKQLEEKDMIIETKDVLLEEKDMIIETKDVLLEEKDKKMDLMQQRIKELESKLNITK